MGTLTATVIQPSRAFCVDRVGRSTQARTYDTYVTDQPLDLFGRRLRDLRISVTDRCNFRCVYCMPREVFGKDFQFLAALRPAHVRGDRARRDGVRDAGRREAAADRWRAAAAPRSRAPRREARAHRRDRGCCADHERRAAREEGAEPRGRRAEARDGLARLARQRHVPGGQRRRRSRSSACSRASTLHSRPALRRSR